MSLNQVTLMGNLTRDPEVRGTAAGSIVKFGLALNSKWKSKTGEDKEKTTFVDCTVFDKRGEAFAKYHKKGSPTLIQGRLELEEWNDKQTGAKRSKLIVIVTDWQFVGGGQPKRDAAPESSGAWPTESAPIAAQTSIDDTPF